MHRNAELAELRLILLRWRGAPCRVAFGLPGARVIAGVQVVVGSGMRPDEREDQELPGRAFDTTERPHDREARTVLQDHHPEVVRDEKAPEIAGRTNQGLKLRRSDAFELRRAALHEQTESLVRFEPVSFDHGLRADASEPQKGDKRVVVNFA